MIAMLLRLYPARWRARYGDELSIVLAERPLGPFDVADLLLAAVDAHLHPRALGIVAEHRRGIPMTLRIGGYAAIVGGVLWFAGLAWSQVGHGAAPGPAMVMLGTLSLLVGLTGLSAFQARRHPRLTWAAFVIPAIGAVVSVVGLAGIAATGDEPFVGGVSGWYLWFIGSLTLVVGSGLFAIATWRVRTLSRRGAGLLGAGCVALVPAIGGGVGGPEMVAQLLLAASLGSFAGGWLALGVSALRTSPAPAVGSAA